MLSRFYPRHSLNFIRPTGGWAGDLRVRSGVVGIPLKIWNAIRIDRQLEEQRRLLLEARLDALAAADQSALPVQYAELDCLAGALQAGVGAGR